MTKRRIGFWVTLLGAGAAAVAAHKAANDWAFSDLIRMGRAAGLDTSTGAFGGLEELGQAAGADLSGDLDENLRAMGRAAGADV